MGKEKAGRRQDIRIRDCFREDASSENLSKGMEEVKIDDASNCTLPSGRRGGPTIAETADRHECYHEAVQSVEREVKNMVNIYLELRGAAVADAAEDVDFQHRMPLVLREDFCGTAVLCREWVSRNILRTAIGVDLDTDVLKYSRENVINGSISDRIQLLCANVLSLPEDMENADIIAAFNYGVCYFHKFDTLVSYLKKCRDAIAPGGIFICDIFGGQEPDASGSWSFKRQCSNFLYIFEQSPIDLLTNQCRFSISFKFSDGSCLKDSYNYHFRIWTIADIRDALQAAGFGRIEVWATENKVDKNGMSLGPGEFKRVKAPHLILRGSWNAYLVGVP